MAGPELELPGGRFAPGDRVVVKRNDRRRGVDNGDRGRVLAVDREQGSLLLQIGDRQVVLDHDYLTGTTSDGEPTLLHGYAITGHVAQGLTVDRSYVLADEGISLEWGYVALSRGREENQLYLVLPTGPGAGGVRTDRDRASRSDRPTDRAPADERRADPRDRRRPTDG